MVKKLRELTTERLFSANLVREGRKPKKRIISCQVGDTRWYQYGSLRLPARFNRLWRWLAGRR